MCIRFYSVCVLPSEIEISALLLILEYFSMYMGPWGRGFLHYFVCEREQVERVGSEGFFKSKSQEVYVL